MIKSVRSRVQVAEIGFLQKARGSFLFDKVESSDIWQCLKHQPVAAPHKKIATALVRPCDTNVPQVNSKATKKCSFRRKRPRGRPRTRWRDYAEDLAWLRLGIPPAELPLVAGDRDAWRSQLKLLLPQPQKDKRAKGITLK